MWRRAWRAVGAWPGFTPVARRLVTVDRWLGRVTRGRVVALGMAPFGSLQGGWVAERFGVRTSFAVGGVISLLAVGLVVYSFRQVVHAAAKPTPSPGPVSAPEASEGA